MKKVIILIIILCALGYALPQSAWSEFYRYTDEKGSVHITDSPGKIPPKYREVAVDVTPQEKHDGFTPSISQMIDAEEMGTNVWYDYEGMKFYERWGLLVRAGFLDIKPILIAMWPWLGMAVFLLCVLCDLILHSLCLLIRPHIDSVSLRPEIAG